MTTWALFILTAIILLLAFILCIAFVVMWAGYQVFQDQHSTIAFFAENLIELHAAVKGFRNHLQAIQGLADFYGEEAFKNILEHTRKLDEYLSKFEEMYATFLEERDLNEDIFELDEETEEEQSNSDETKER